MNSLLSLFRKAAMPLLLICVPGSAAALESWPSPPTLTELATPWGRLAVSESEYVYEARLRLDNADINPPIVGRLAIRYAFKLPDRQAALVSISSGNDSCPVSYRWITLSADGYQVSPAFGSCSEKIRVSASARSLSVSTPSRDTPGQIDSYVFDGKDVRRVSGKRSTRR